MTDMTMKSPKSGLNSKKQLNVARYRRNVILVAKWISKSFQYLFAGCKDKDTENCLTLSITRMLL